MLTMPVEAPARAEQPLVEQFEYDNAIVRNFATATAVWAFAL